MKLKDLKGFNSLNSFVFDKIKRLNSYEKTFEVLFDFMFEQEDNVFAETSRGFRISTLTYGEVKKQTINFAKKLKQQLSCRNEGAMVGLYMENSVSWIIAYWAILMCGFNPLLLNSRLPKEQLEKVIKTSHVAAVISDSKEFNVLTLNYQSVENSSETAPLTTWGSETYFMSSGTTRNVKLCAYTAENFYHQITNSCSIMDNCPPIETGYKGSLKHLVLLPFYHVFGFVAVYIWFGFFARTFVFLKSLNAQILLRTVRIHKVTHIFAVPMVWETIYKQAIKAVRTKGEKTYNKFKKALDFTNKHQVLGSIVSKYAFKQIRENLFGDSIQLLISGGSAISKEAIEFFNGIGYFAVNGYGMTEVAITSFEMAKKRKDRNKVSIGAPFSNVEYKIDGGELYIKSKARASKIISEKGVEVTDFEKWFATNDMAKNVDGKYYLLGRQDDLIISSSGENVNPQFVEDSIKVDGVTSKCLVKSKMGVALILEIGKWQPSAKLKEIELTAKKCLKEANFESEVNKIILTRTKLLEEKDFKISRTKIAKKLDAGLIESIEFAQNEQVDDVSDLENEIIKIYKEVLGDSVNVSVNDDFFTDLNGTSLEYFEIAVLIKDKFSLSESFFEGKTLNTAKQFANEIIKELE
ncbi:MAG: AMP-binding protein [Clostridia bacterium]|nr:AMP-binding protein [Clostridia bacterium]